MWGGHFREIYPPLRLRSSTGEIPLVVELDKSNDQPYDREEKYVPLYQGFLGFPAEYVHGQALKPNCMQVCSQRLGMFRRKSMAQNRLHPCPSLFGGANSTIAWYAWSRDGAKFMQGLDVFLKVQTVIFWNFYVLPSFSGGWNQHRSRTVQTLGVKPGSGKDGLTASQRCRLSTLPTSRRLERRRLRTDLGSL